jgi:Ca2+-binding RTX toxin-like protein
MPSLPLWLRVSGVAALAAGAALAAAPADAATTAGTAKVTSDATIQFTAGAGATNVVVVTGSGRTITVDDTVAVNPGTGCKRVGTDKTKVSCTTKKTVTSISVSLGDRNDSLTAKAAVSVVASGGAGNDTLTGGAKDDTLYGGAGDDKLNGAGGTDILFGDAGNDQLNGGAGDVDELIGGPGADTLNGGPGAFDLAGYEDHTTAVTADLDGANGDDGAAGEKDTIATDVEGILGGTRNDVLTGNNADNLIAGLGGDDRISGLGGDDLLFGEQPDGDARTTTGADTVDGGGNGVFGDLCVVGADGTATGCEMDTLPAAAASKGGATALTGWNWLAHLRGRR